MSHKALEDQIYEISTSYIEQSYRFGVAKSFKGNVHYARMSSKLKNQLVMAVLKQYYDKMVFFFHDIHENNFSDQDLIRRLLISLDCMLYEPGTTIIEAAKPMEYIYFPI